MGTLVEGVMGGGAEGAGTEARGVRVLDLDDNKKEI